MDYRDEFERLGDDFVAGVFRIIRANKDHPNGIIAKIMREYPEKSTSQISEAIDLLHSIAK